MIAKNNILPKGETILTLLDNLFVLTVGVYDEVKDLAARSFSWRGNHPSPQIIVAYSPIRVTIPSKISFQKKVNSFHTQNSLKLPIIIPNLITIDSKKVFQK